MSATNRTDGTDGLGSDARCAACDAEAGVVLDPADALVSHGVCARHYCEQLLRSHLPASAVRDRAVRLFGSEIGLAAFDTATRILAVQLRAA